MATKEKKKGMSKAAAKAAAEKEVKAKAAKKEEKAIVKVEILPPLKNLNEDQLKARAIDNDKRCREIDLNLRKDFIDFCEIVIEMRNGGLWKYVPATKNQTFASFKEWVKDAAPFSTASGYEAVKVGERLLPVIPKEELKQLPRHTLKVLVDLPASKRADKKIIEAAKNAKGKKGRKAFLKTVKEVAPEAHIEESGPFYFPQSSRQVLDYAVAVKNWIENPHGEGPKLEPHEAVEGIVVDWLAGPCEVEGYFGMSNRQGYDQYIAELEKQEGIQVVEAEEEEPEETLAQAEYSAEEDYEEGDDTNTPQVAAARD